MNNDFHGCCSEFCKRWGWKAFVNPHFLLSLFQPACSFYPGGFVCRHQNEPMSPYWQRTLATSKNQRLGVQSPGLPLFAERPSVSCLTQLPQSSPPAWEHHLPDMKCGGSKWRIHTWLSAASREKTRGSVYSPLSSSKTVSQYHPVPFPIFPNMELG